MAELEVDAQDVVRLMLQFCKENGLKDSLKMLQTESQVALNTVESVEGFLTDVQTGNWDAVLTACASLQLPEREQALAGPGGQRSRRADAPH